MDEYDVQTQLRHSMEFYNYQGDTNTDAVICPKCHRKILPSRGKPDVTFMHPTSPALYVEMKVLRASDTSFPFRRIETQQRVHLSKWATRNGKAYLGLGAIRPHGKVERLDHLWLIDWLSWVDVEITLKKHQKSIPLVACKGMKRVLQDNNLDLLHLLQEYEMTRQLGGWRLPANHSAIPHS
jgi:hypothetical protein